MRGNENFNDVLKLAEQGNTIAQAKVGGMYASGQGVTQNYEEAIKWFRKAAEEGHVLAQTGLGMMYAKGEGVAQDYAEALKWFRKATAQGEAEAQCWLGFMYDTGLGVAKNRQEAIKWYRKAAEQGHASAQVSLGVRYFVTEDCREFKPRIDNIEAYKWLILAAAQGNQYAVDFRDVLKQKMTATQIAEAQKLANEFLKK
ncbi:MAG: tetratricopeptide repeat protein [Sedimentisphaerales bacterium]|jgi:TPR repeat protein